MRKLFVLAVGALAALAVTAAPVGAAGQPAVCAGWEADGAGMFDGLSSLTGSADTARAADNVVREPSLNAT